MLKKEIYMLNLLDESQHQLGLSCRKQYSLYAKQKKELLYIHPKSQTNMVNYGLRVSIDIFCFFRINGHPSYA